MTKTKKTPGPIADQTFDSGFKTAAIGGVAVLVALFLTGRLSLIDGAHLLYALVLFPVYLLIVATVLGVWLGYDTDATNLKPVTRTPDTESDEK